MANSRAKPAGWSTGEPIEPAEINQIDTNQAKAWVNDGTTTLTDDCTISIGPNTLALNTGGGAGQVTFDTYPGYVTAITDKRCPFSLCASPSVWGGGYGGYFQDLSSGGGNQMALLLDMPLGFQLTSIKLEVRGSTTGTLPASKAQILLFKYAVGAYDTGTQIGSTATDSSGTNAAYVANHTISISSISETVAANIHYILHVNVPSDAQATSGFRVYRVWVSGNLQTIQP